VTTCVDPYRIDRDSVPTSIAVGVLVASLGVAVVGRAAGVGQADTIQTFVLIFSTAQQKKEIAKIDFVSLASVTTDPGYARDIGVQPGTRVRFVGFAVRTGRSDRFRLARFLISCCAADAVPVFIDVKAGREPIPPDNAWLEVTGGLVQERGAFLVAAESLKRVDAPSNPYVTMKW
jgi:uncharacterized repeat protein (TIGR03943 family)